MVLTRADSTTRDPARTVARSATITSVRPERFKRTDRTDSPAYPHAWAFGQSNELRSTTASTRSRWTWLRWLS
jgi:hypothetical protein